MSAEADAATARPGAEPPVAGPAGNVRRMFRFWTNVLPFVAALSAILYFTLVPNSHHNLFDGLPAPIRDWMGTHDNLANIAAFFVLGILTFRAARVLHRPKPVKSNGLQTDVDAWCLTVLLTSVCLIEIVQLGIPGRDGSFHDVVTGSLGILGAWWLRRKVP